MPLFLFVWKYLSGFATTVLLSISLKGGIMSQSDELKRYRCYEIFSQSTGVEIREAVKTSEEHGLVTERSGRIHLRFFKLTPKVKPDDVTQIRFICEPDEAFSLSQLIRQVSDSAVSCKEKLNPHMFSAGEKNDEIVTTVSVEKWERGGKSGFAMTVGRGKDFISVPVPRAKFLFAGEFLRVLSTEQCWVERVEKKR